jgi:hypothetical protein
MTKRIPAQNEVLVDRNPAVAMPGAEEMSLHSSH